MSKTIVSISQPTPKWATWLFRIVFLITTAGMIWVGATRLIQDDSKVEIMLAMKVLDVVVWGIGRGLGVKKEDYEDTVSQP